MLQILLIFAPFVLFSQVDRNLSNSTQEFYDFPIEQSRKIYPRILTPACVCIIGGQSNAVGTGDTLKLANQNIIYSRPNVRIFTVGRFGGSKNKFQVFHPGVNSNGENRGWIGVETSIVNNLENHEDCNGLVFVFKAAFPASNLEHGWAPNNNLKFKAGRGWDQFLGKMYRQGYYPNIKIITWLQGESDARQTKQTAENYYVNIKQFMFWWRNNLNAYTNKIAIVRIHDNVAGQQPYQETVRAAQEKFVTDYQNYLLINSDDIPRQGKTPFPSLHYSADGYIQLGHRIFEALQ